EYQMKRINQTQVKPEIGLTFANGLRSLVRQDPDIVMVGEIRDSETVGLAINAALTGHLVLSTLHTNSAAGAIPRLIDMGAESFLLVSTINVIIAQRLIRKLSDTKEKYILSASEKKALEDNVDLERVLSFLKKEKVVKEKDDWSTIPFYRPKKGLPAARLQGRGQTPKASAQAGANSTAGEDDGYSGRIGIHEVFAMSGAIKNMVMKGTTTDEIEAEAKKEGMLTMIEDGIFKAAQGITSIEEVLRVATQ
ncbi:MAG: ATPase, T2SS/T4P/T4SS family, partial [bacterium]|nr:ATPase, T2SS/T4P/T4SS family [bacterium]